MTDAQMDQIVAGSGRRGVDHNTDFYSEGTSGSVGDTERGEAYNNGKRGMTCWLAPGVSIEDSYCT
jgi:hypothetical protein